MPDMDGRTLCARIRRISQVPIIFLTGLGSELDVISAFGAGADEYLVKPPRASELRARVRALLRQDQMPANTRNYYDDGYLVVDIAARRVQKQGTRVDRSPLGFRLLSYLVARRGQLVSHQELIEAMWATTQGKDPAMLHLYIRYLRGRLEPEPSQPRYLLEPIRRGLLVLALSICHSPEHLAPDSSTQDYLAVGCGGTYVYKRLTLTGRFTPLS